MPLTKCGRVGFYYQKIGSRGRGKCSCTYDAFREYFKLPNKMKKWFQNWKYFNWKY